MPRKGLITRDELLAAGALYVPPEWRKSLSARMKDKKKDQQRDLISMLDDDDAADESAEVEPEEDVEEEGE
jgi:hypothetical protein